MTRRIGIGYLAPRNVAYSSLFFRFLKHMLRVNNVYAGTYFLDDDIELEDTRSSPAKLDALFVSLPYEIMYRDLVEFYNKTSIMPYRSKADDNLIVIGGGPAVTANPLPVLDFLDVILVGEIEEVFDDIISILSERTSKTTKLKKLAELRGVIVPRLELEIEKQVERIYTRDLDKYTVVFDQKLPPEVEPVWGRSYAIESSRGCGRGCRFCMEGFIFRPKRDRSFHTLKNLIDNAREQGYNKISFYSLAFFDNPDAEKALEYAVSMGYEVSVPSIRAETITERRLELIKEGGQKTLTIAPETASCRLCNAINKRIGKDLVLEIIEKMLGIGLRQVKMYIMVGFPGETEDDISEIISLIRESSLLLAKAGGKLKISINQFMPKPVTPLQWAPLKDYLATRKIIRLIGKEARKIGAEASWYDPRWARIQTILSRGDREVSKIIYSWARHGKGLGAFRRAVRESGIDPEKYLAEWPATFDPPWHKIIRHPYASLKLLRREYEIFQDIISQNNGSSLRLLKR
ncbi:MAG: radical SAM protein [Desulfurococcales archaeon]|nr:radical SAM protein [Desulfurococcales archaeon]